ncbi:APC family permease [Arthrobacter sp. 35W]|uniref:APC family permease n=1 Tax=Arthrobacter sp. 35W TaxID=1132441 RepID=UPI00040B24FD|nr:APC family permease [Arthrobacter sp. 35W]
MDTQPALGRRLGTTDAVVIGLGSMIGAGVFAAFAPAAQAAGSGLLVGLAVAAVAALCNATSSAQLAAQYPESGGTYIYGRRRLGEWPGFLAGWGFVFGKTASSAAMAMTFAAYAAPPGWGRPVAIAAVAALAAVNYRGVTKTARLARILVVAVLAALAVVVAVCWAQVTGPGVGARILGPGLLDSGWYGILQSAGLLFFAFAGYARIATMGGEVKDPSRTIPRAIMLALGVAVVLYALVGTSLLAALGPDGVAESAAPLAAAAAAGPWAWAVPVVAVGAALAALGALLGLLAGLGRTTMAMAREGDLPVLLAAIHPRFHVPHRAEVVLAVLICAVILVADLRGAIGFSSFGVLVYYLVANLAALTQARPQRRYPRALAVAGAVLCVVLAATLPVESVLAGGAMFAVGAAYRLVRLRLRPPARAA